MGTTTDPNEPGLLCSTCWGLDKPFGSGPTPERVVVRVVGALPGALQKDFPASRANGFFLCRQVEPCWWMYEDDTVQVSWVLGLGWSLLHIVHIVDSQAWGTFFSNPPVSCIRTFKNAYVNYATTLWFGGNAGVEWGF